MRSHILFFDRRFLRFIGEELGDHREVKRTRFRGHKRKPHPKGRMNLRAHRGHGNAIHPFRFRRRSL